MAYEDQTKDAILARMLALVADDIDKRQGSVVHDMLSPAAVEAALLYIALSSVLDKGFADTAFDEYLERRTAELGVTRKPSEQAVGSVTFTGASGTIIKAGQRVATDSLTPVYFVTTADATIGAGGSVSVAAEAEVGGISGNVVAGAIKRTVGNLSGAVTVTNAAPFSGGVDKESDESLLARYEERLQAPATSGNANHYLQWAKEIPGISDAKVYPVWNGNGTVKVVLLDDQATAPDPAKVAEVAAHIEEIRPVGATVTVVAATEVPINISATMTLAAGVTLVSIQLDISARVADYLKTLAFADPIVRITQIGNIVLDTPGVVDYTNLKINGGTANLAVADGSVAVIGSVTLT